MTNQFGNLKQWRITVNGSTGPVIDNPATISTNWADIAAMLDARAGKATLETRILFPDLTILDLLQDRTGWLNLKGKALSPWSIEAEIETR